MAKHANGEGTKYKLKNGKWAAALYVPLPDGSKYRKYHRCRTRKEADEWLTTMKSEISAGKPVLCSDQPFGEYIEQWFTKLGSVAIRESTRMNYEGYVRHILRHKLKDVKLKYLTTDDLQEFILFLQNAGHLDASEHQLSAKTIHNIIHMIHKALQHAVGRQLIYHNPADYVQLPKVITPEMRVLTETEISRFVSAMEGDSLQIALILMLFSGLRLGECCALTHDDVCCDDGIHYLYKVLDKRLLMEAEKYLQKHLAFLRDYGYMQIPELKCRIMKSKWGVCYTKKNSITISSYLIHYPLYCLEYIMVHEMTHFIVPNHSKRFYEVVVNNMPDYKRAVKRLKL